MEENISVTVYTVDSSFVLAFLLKDENNEKVDKIFWKYEKFSVKLISTTLLPYEVSNALRSAVIKKRLDNEMAKELFVAYQKLNIELHEVDFEMVLKLAINENLSTYDASYIVLARSKQSSLFTLDERLTKSILENRN